MATVKDYIKKLGEIKKDIKDILEGKDLHPSNDFASYPELIKTAIDNAGVTYNNIGLEVVYDFNIGNGAVPLGVGNITEVHIPQGWNPPSKSLYGLFRNMYSLQKITGFENLDLSKITNMSEMIYGNNSLSELPDLYKLDLSKFSGSWGYAFQALGNIKGECLDLFDITPNITGMHLVINNFNTESISIGTWDLENCSFAGNYVWQGAITHIKVREGGKGFINIKNNLYNLFSKLNLDRESALLIFNGLVKPTSGTRTLTLSSITKSYLTEEDIAIATNKGWTVA